MVLEKGIALNMHFKNGKKTLDESDRIVGTLLMDLYKAYDFVNHELIIAKLAAYVLNEGSLRLIQNYISKRKQWVKIGSSLK